MTSHLVLVAVIDRLLASKLSEANPLAIALASPALLVPAARSWSLVLGSIE